MQKQTKYICVQYIKSLYRYTGVFSVCVFNKDVVCNQCNVLGSYVSVGDPTEGGLCSKCQCAFKNIYAINNISDNY